MRGRVSGKGFVFLFLLLTAVVFSVSQVEVRQSRTKELAQETGETRTVVSPKARDAAAIEALARGLGESRKSGDEQTARLLFSLLFPPEERFDPVEAWKTAAEEARIPSDPVAGEPKSPSGPGRDLPVMTSAADERRPSIEREPGPEGPGPLFVASERWLGGSAYDILMGRSPDSGATWPAALTIGGLYPLSGPVLRRVARGEMGLVFTEHWQYAESDVHFARLSDDLASVSRTPVACGSVDEDWPSLASDFGAFVSPYIYVTYAEHSDTAYRVRVRVSPDGGETWSGPVTIGSFSAPGGLACYTALAFDPDTLTLYAAYAGWQGASQGIAVAASASFGASWSSPVFVTPADDRPDLFPRLAAAAGGAVLVYEHAVSDTNGDIEFARTVDGGLTWTAARGLAAGPGDERWPDVREVGVPGAPRFYASYVKDHERVVVRSLPGSGPEVWTGERDLKTGSGWIDDGPVSLTVSEEPSGLAFPIVAWAEPDPDYDIYITATALTVTPENQNVSAGAGTTTFAVTKTGSGKVDWTAQVVAGGTWLSVQSGSAGTNAGTITAAFTANPDAGSRVGTIRVADVTEVLPPSDVTVTQAAAPQLVVTPATGLTSSGPQGGPFSPASASYTLQNQGGSALGWTAAATQSWVTVTPPSGTIAAGATATVTVSINSGANSLAAGTYADTATFTNTTNGSGSTTRPVSLTVTAAPGTLTVTPAGGLVSSGPQGGPFSPASLAYTLQNTGNTALNWTAAKTQSWVTVSPATGALAAGATATVTVSINSAANALALGAYGDTVTFTNTTNGNGTTTRPVSLTVTAPPGVLAVTPAGGLVSSGIQGGPFSPAGLAYTLQNTGGSALSWTVAGTQTWVSVSSASGTLAAGETTAVTISISSAANALAPGTYSDTVTFTNTTNGGGTTTRPVALTVNPSPGALTVTPSAGLISSGTQGGPFTPPSLAYTLQNTGGTAFNWSAAATQGWVAVSPVSGTLAAGATATVTVSINATANTFTAGTYGDTVTFTNTTNGSGNTTRSVSLTVNPPAGELVVTPGQGLLSSGTEGGPFSPVSQIYTLQNSGGSTLNWTASKAQAWVTLSASSGILASGGTAMVTVSINSAANALAAGAYGDTVTFTNTTNGSGTTTRPVNLTVNPPPGTLTVTPAGGLISSGVQGGPFSPASLAYTLQNAGGVALDWTAAKAQTWVTLSTTAGTLAPGAMATVTVSINTEANALSSGSYGDTVVFTNTTGGNLTVARPVHLTVSPPPGALTVTPGGGFVASGTQGGPFSPASLTYTLQNTGGVSLDWNASATQSWVTLSIASGTISPAGTATVRVSINSLANALAAGSYSDTVTFTNATNGSGTTTRPVSLTVTPPPGALSVSPTGGFVSTGVQGGPFEPASLAYALRNTGGSAIDWTAAKYQSWLTLSASSGTLAPNETTTVTASINATADNLTAGSHSDILTFTNSTNGNGTTTRPVSLTVTPPPRLAVSPANQDVAYLDGTVSFEVSNSGTGTLDWIAEVIWGEDWVTIQTGTSGTNAGTIVASFTANQDAGSRQAFIRVLAPGAAGSPKDVTVTQASGLLGLVLEAQRLVERAWIVQREYGSLRLTLSNPAGMAVGSFVVYRKAAGQAYEALTELAGSALQDGGLTYSDVFLQTGVGYTYKIVALDAKGSMISESNEVTI